MTEALTDMTSRLRAWLANANRRYSVDHVPHARRPFLALADYTRERKLSLSWEHPIAQEIFRWFEQNSPPDSHQVGSVYKGLFFFDAAFWPVTVPLVLGEAVVKAVDCLPTMPAEVLGMLADDIEESNIYAFHWRNCMEYGFAWTGGGGGSIFNERARSFFAAGHDELVGANVQLLQTPPNLKAILGLRMATEIFLKAVLVQELDMDDKELMRISHRIDTAAMKCMEVTGEAAFGEVADDAKVFPAVRTRYASVGWSSQQVWDAALLTQYAAATVAKRYGRSNFEVTH